MDRSTVMIAFPVTALAHRVVLNAILVDAGRTMDELQNARAGRQSLDALDLIDGDKSLELDETGKAMLITDFKTRGLFDRTKRRLIQAGLAFDEHLDGEVNQDRVIRYWRPGFNHVLNVGRRAGRLRSYGLGLGPGFLHPVRLYRESPLSKYV